MAIKTANGLRLTTIPIRTAFRGDCPSSKTISKSKSPSEEKPGEKKEGS